jgi:5-formyltetrahydrofolate cyclo-ligase
MTRGKEALRKALREARRALLPGYRASAEARVVGRLLSLLTGARCVALYAAQGSELAVDLCFAPLEARGVRVLWPRVTGQELELAASRLADLGPGYRGIREPLRESPPIGLREVDALVVPGLGFDRQGHRLGQGGGYYDRLLARGELRARRIGVAFAAQILPVVPATGCDLPVELVVTELGQAERGAWSSGAVAT